MRDKDKVNAIVREQERDREKEQDRQTKRPKQTERQTASYRDRRTEIIFERIHQDIHVRGGKRTFRHTRIC